MGLARVSVGVAQGAGDKYPPGDTRAFMVMPRLRVCAECHRLTPTTRCAVHQRRRLGDGRVQTLSGSAAARGYDADWRRVREQILSTEPFCRRCRVIDPRSLTLATDVDHIQPLADGGARLDPDNLQPLCADCHRTKTLEDRFARGRP